MPETEHVEMCQMVIRCYCNLINALQQLEVLKVYTLLEGVIKGTVIKLLFFFFCFVFLGTCTAVVYKRKSKSSAICAENFETT